MDLLNGAGVPDGQQNGSTPKTLNVIAPDHPFWNQSVSSQKLSMLQHQFFAPPVQQQLSNQSISSTEDLGLSNLKLVGQTFLNNGLENSIPLDDAPNPYMQPKSLNHQNSLRLAPIGSSSAYQVSENMPNLFDFRDVFDNHNGMSQQNTLITNNQRQATASESLSKASSLINKPSTPKHENNHAWPERNQYSKQKSNYIEQHNGIGPRFKNTAISKPNTSPTNIPVTSSTYVSKANQQPPRLMNKKIAQNNPRNGTHTSDRMQNHRPTKHDDLSISLSSTSDEEEEESFLDDTGVWLYVAKSNMWVDSENLNKGLKNNKGSTENNEKKLRLDLGKLTEIVKKGRQVIDFQCYGPEPPDIDTIWKLAKKKGWDSVSPKNNNTLRYETQNELDAPISTDIMELVGCSHLKTLKFEKCKNVVVLIASETGEDLPKIIGKVMNQEGWWKIEIWSTKDHISNNVRELAEEYPEIVEINYLDQEKVKERFKFTHYKLDLKGKVDKIDKRWLYNYGIVFEDVNLEIGAYVGEAFQKVIKDLDWPYKYIWMKDEKNKLDVHLNLLILFERPNASKGKEKSEFLGDHLPKLRNSLLNDLCRRIVSYHEYDKEKNDDDDDISFTNRYSFLTDVMDDEEDLESQEMSDEPVNAPFDLFEELEKHEETINQSKETEWEQVIHKPRGGPSPAQIYPTRCIYGFICTYGTKCHYEHTKEEKEVFQARTAAKKIGKVPFHDNKYRTELCNFNIPHDRAACPFAHGMTQMICKICYKVGHDVDTCTVKKVVTTPSDDGKLTW